MIHRDIVDRYVGMLGDTEARCEPDPGTELTHIAWMLDELGNGGINGEKAHRWLGFIQGVMIMNGLTTVQTERNFTRPYFTK